LVYDELYVLRIYEADVFLFPSIREGESLGLVLVEAIFCGCIPLAIENGAVSEVLAGPMGIDLSVREEDYTYSLKMLLLKVSSFPLYSQRLYKQVLNKYSTESVSSDLVDVLKRRENEKS
jgi:glycosyltransferase involved in cell wall biosynthesis